MIEVKVNEGCCEVSVQGHRIEILSEIPIGFGRIMKGVLNNAPDDMRDELIKTIFELTLQELNRRDP